MKNKMYTTKILYIMSHENAHLSLIKCEHGYFKSNHPYQRMWQSNKKSSLQIAIFERDGYKCVRCGSTESLLVDHIDGDKTHECPENLQTLCKGCNRRKACKEDKENRAKRENEGWELIKENDLVYILYNIKFRKVKILEKTKENERRI